MLPYDVRLTRTPLAGGGSTTVTELAHRPLGRVRSANVQRTQSVGVPQAHLVLGNEGRAFDAWTQGDSLKIETRGVGRDWQARLDGFIAHVSDAPDDPVRSALNVTVLGWSAVLDLVKLADDKSYLEKKWTDIADDVITTVLGAGYARSIDADSTTTDDVRFGKGTTLRAALDVVRAGLNQGSDKWELTIDIVAGTRTVKLVKRSGTSQKTMTPVDVLPGSIRDRGPLSEVANRVTMFGAKVPWVVQDHSAKTKVDSYFLDATTKRLAIPFTAGETPLARVSFKADRSLAKDPPILKAWVARASDSIDIITESVLRHAHIIRRRQNAADDTLVDPHFLTDLDQGGAGKTTQARLPATVTGFTEMIAYDLGAGRSRKVAGRMAQGQSGGQTLKLQGSNDDAAWTDIDTSAWIDTNGTLYGSPSAAYRYFRFAYEGSGAGDVRETQEAHHFQYGNLATDPATPGAVHDALRSGGGATKSTTGAQTFELARFDFETSQRVAKIEAKHQHSGGANSLVNLFVQRSSDGSTWTDIAVFTTATGPVTDTRFIQEEPFRHLRVIVKDDRTAGSANYPNDLMSFHVYLHADDVVNPINGAVHGPLIGDKVDGVEASWSWEDLPSKDKPALVAEATFSTPTVGLVTGKPYYLVLEAQAGAAVDAYWEIQYAGVPDPATGWLFERGAWDGLGTTPDHYGSNDLSFAGSEFSGKHGQGLLDSDTPGTRKGHSVRFDGTNARILRKTSGLTGLPAGTGSKWSAALWLKIPGAPGATQTVLAYGDSAEADGKVLLVQVDTARKILAGTKGAGNTVTSGTALTANTWTHVAVTCDGTNVRIYVNGVLDAGPTALATNNLEQEELYVGSDLSEGTNYDGHAYRPTIWNAVALSAAEVQDLYDDDSAGFDAGVVGYALISTDSGATHKRLSPIAVPLSKLSFKDEVLEHTVDDATSQTKYANLVPNGVLAAAFHDEALRSLDAVKAAAAAHLQRRKDATSRYAIRTRFDPGLVEGKRVTLNADAARLFGVVGAIELDVVEVHDEPGGAGDGVIVLHCNDHFPDAGIALGEIASTLTKRSV